MKKFKTKFKDLYIFQSKNYYDNRGFFRELFLEKQIKAKLKFFVVSKSKKKCFKRYAFSNQESPRKISFCLEG